ncbi:hypothetical protein HCH_02900 [Hahella chejuensis KCTC 2396]|uniref:Uncharacterized protein n=1 Tax=Hahella chejuensis (strain KCTC 2396) TaxID=349521 RepID=Q2SI50_HAHCH|nr:hypothetical protein [Hahella chejuensis]ABC29674.1 hypothetical protein HCH_02900 [Hahella chejuensis KCTC 2396]
MGFPDDAGQMIADVFAHRAEPGALAGVDCNAIVKEEVVELVGYESISHVREQVAEFLLSEITPRKGQALVLESGGSYVLGDEVRKNRFVAAYRLKEQ